MFQPTKNYRDFIRKFGLASFPFKTHIGRNKTYRKRLFLEFLKTEPTPDVHLHALSSFTAIEITAIIEDGRNKIPISSGKGIVAANFIPYTAGEGRLKEIHAEFFEKLGRDSLDAAFYSFDLDQTNTIKTLKEIESELEVMRGEVFEDEGTIHYEKRAKIFAKTINSLLTRLENQSLAEEVRDDILKNNENIHIVIRGIVEKRLRNNYSSEREQARKYSLLKRPFNQYLVKPKMVNKTTDPKYQFNLVFNQYLANANPITPIPSTEPTPALLAVKAKRNGLTARQSALLAVLQNRRIERSGGDNSAYNFYNKLCRTSDRTGYANESPNKAKKLIEDYEAILNQLTPDQKQKANSEMITIRADRF